MINNLIPQNLEIEIKVLGALLFNNSFFFDIDLKTEYFCLEKHQLVFRAIRHKIKNGETTSSTLLIEDFKKYKILEQVGGMSFLLELEISGFLTLKQLQEGIEVLKEKYIRRKLITFVNKQEQLICDEKIETKEIISSIENDISDIPLSSEENGETKQIITELNQLQEEFSKSYEQGNKYIGEQCGISKIDMATDGLRPEHLWVVGAWTSTGKTQFVLNIVHSVIWQNIPVTFISLEMSKIDLVCRLIAVRHDIDSRSVLKGFVNKEEQELIQEGKDFISKAPLNIYNNYTDIEEIKLLMKKEVVKNKTKLFVIDYVQLIQSKKHKSDYEKYTQVTQDLININKKLKTTTILVSQISNESQKGQGAGAGFKGTGELQSAPDLTIKLFRELEKENPGEIEVPIRIKIEKNRHGQTGSINDYVMNLKSGKYKIIQPKQNLKF